MREKELFARTSELLDLSTCDVYSPHLRATLNTFNPKGEDFDAESLLDMIGGSALRSLLSGPRPLEPVIETDEDLTDYQRRVSTYQTAVASYEKTLKTVSHILPRLLNLKGTQRGLKLLLGLAGLNPTVFVGWEVWRGFPKTVNPDHRPGPDDIYLNAYNDFLRTFPDLAGDVTELADLACKVYFRVGLSGGGSSDDLPRDELILNIVRRFMPTCTRAIVSRSNDIDSTDERNNMGVFETGPDDYNKSNASRIGILISGNITPEDFGAEVGDTGPDTLEYVDEDGNTQTETLVAFDADDEDGRKYLTLIKDKVGDDRIQVNTLLYSAGAAYGRGPDDSERYSAGAGASGLTIYDSIHIDEVRELTAGTTDYDPVPQAQWHIT